MIEEKVPLTVQHIIDAGRQYLMIIAVEPEVGVLSDVGGVVPSVQGPNVVDHSEEDILVVRLLAHVPLTNERTV